MTLDEALRPQFVNAIAGQTGASPTTIRSVLRGETVKRSYRSRLVVLDALASAGVVLPASDIERARAAAVQK